MPKMSGKDLAGKIQNIRPDIKTLFTSGYTANAIAHQGVLDKGVQFLQKPFTLEQLAQKVRGAMGSVECRVKNGKGTGMMFTGILAKWALVFI